MNTLGYIILLVAMMVICLVKKQNMERMRALIDPMFGVGLILVGAGVGHDGLTRKVVR